MAKKKNSVVNQIENVNLEIDYDKLASAIVKAQNETFLNDRKNKKARNALIMSFNALFYAVVCLFCVGFVIFIWYSYIKTTAYSLLQSVYLTFLLLFVAGFSAVCCKETYFDGYKDSMDLFNANISLIALVIAIVALTK